MQNFLAGQGLSASNLASDVKRASGTASDALEQARPTVDSTLVTLSKSSPALLAEYALGAVALYYLVRPRICPCNFFIGWWWGCCWCCSNINGGLSKVAFSIPLVPEGS